MALKKTTEQFIEEAICKHGWKYNYSLVDYINNRTKVKIICKGRVLTQRPDKHLEGKNPSLSAKNGYFNLNLPIYSTFNNTLSQYGIPSRRCKEDYNILETKCHQCKCWFIPPANLVWNKISSIKGIRAGSSNMYCSNTCRDICITHNQITYPKHFKPYISREVQPQLRKMRLEIDNHECQICSSKERLECHHYDGVELNPVESADLDRCVTVCHTCHKDLHKIPGYTYQNFKRKPCSTE